MNGISNNRQQLKIFVFLQFFIITLLGVFIFIIVDNGSNQEIPFSKIQNSLTTQPSVTALTPKTMAEAGKEMSFDSSLIEEGLYYRIDDIMNVNELLVIKISDDNNRELVLEALNKYLEEKKNSFEGYGTDQFGLLNNAVSMEKGDYIFFGVSPDVLTWESSFESCFR